VEKDLLRLPREDAISTEADSGDNMIVAWLHRAFSDGHKCLVFGNAKILTNIAFHLASTVFGWQFRTQLYEK
jgi:hypothetical protein